MAWGDICGLKSTDLSADLLKKLEFTKLLECIDGDNRVSHIISARLLDQEIESIRYLNNVPKEIIVKYPNIISIYNRYLEKNRLKIDAQYSYYRSNTVLWHMLDDGNKRIELQNWINHKNSVIRDDTVDYPWLYKKYPKVAEELRIKVLAQIDNGKYYQNGLAHLVSNMPKPHSNELMDRIFKTASKNLKLAALSNKNLQDKYTVKALKIMAKRTRSVRVRANINMSVIKRLPTVTRLEVLEKLVAKKVKISDVSTSEEFRELLFGAVMRHPQRVEKVVKNFERIWRSK